MHSQTPSDREFGLLLIFSLHKVVSRYVSHDNLIQVLYSGLTDVEEPVRVMAVKATCDVIESMISPDSMIDFSRLFPVLLQRLFESIQNGDGDISQRIFCLLEDCVIHSYSFEPNLFKDILSICCSVYFRTCFECRHSKVILVHTEFVSLLVLQLFNLFPKKMFSFKKWFPFVFIPM